MTLTPTVSCGSCGAPMYWAHTESGGRMPLDPEPHPQGNVEIDPESKIAIVHGKKDAEALKSSGGALYRTHFATCPNAAKHRKKK